MEKLKGFTVFNKNTGKKSDDIAYAITCDGNLLMFSRHTQQWISAPSSTYYIQYEDGDLEEY